MNMYRDDGTKVGTKTIQQGAGQQRPDGSFGNGITMKFDPPKAKPQVQQPKSNSFMNSFSGVKAPKIQYEEGRENESKVERDNRFLRNLSMKKNARMQQQYDSMNSNSFNQQQNRTQQQNQFISTLAQRKNSQDANRNQQQNQFLKSFGLNSDKFDYMKNDSSQKNKQKNKQMLQNGKVFDSMYEGHYDKGVNAYFAENPQVLGQARNYYMQNGEMPNANYDDGGYFGSEKFHMDGMKTTPAPIAGDNNTTKPSKSGFDTYLKGLESL